MTVLVLALLAADVKWAPSFAGAQAVSSNSYLTMNCEGQQPFAEIKCKFTETVLHVPEEAEVQKHIAEAKAETGKLADKDLAAMKRECPKLAEAKAELIESPARRRAQQEEIANAEALCACADRACSLRVLLKMEEDKQRTCRLYSQSWELTMRRTSLLSWVANEGPKGSCGNIEVNTLERDPKEEFLWTA
jgi:hypothetical protein